MGETQVSPDFKLSIEEQQQQRTDYAVVVEDACKSYYSDVPVLSNFSMNVPGGTIYSLLGASGCGKTTMLSCIIGTQKLDSGNVFVFGERPGSSGSGIPGRCVGYMPQGVTLYGHLTIKETLQYFGRLFGMTNIEILGRIEFLINFLDLPSPSQQVSSLSGGQQRRTSLAVCLLHEPSLLILDEPTVGVDPLMRESIWNHLCDIVRMKRTTIIITTHYIEEARRSHTVGLMRNGRLLMEKSPSVLLREYDTDLLEDIVLKLCLKDEREQRGGSSASDDDQFQRVYNNNATPSQRNHRPFEFLHHNKNTNEKVITSDEDNNVIGLKFTERCGDFYDEEQKDQDKVIHSKKTRFQKVNAFQKIFALFMRNLLLLSRNPKTLYLAFFAPAIHLVVVNLTIGPTPKFQHLGVVNPEIGMDWSACSSQVISCQVEQFSCLYLNLLAESAITPVMMPDESSAVTSVQEGKTIGFVSFPKNFSADLKQRYISDRFAMEDELNGSTIAFRMDMTNVFSGKLFQKTLYSVFQDFVRKTLKACEFSDHLADIPLRFKAVYGSLEGNYQDYICPAALVVVTHIIPLATGAVALLTDRNEGTLDRSMVAGATITQLLVATLLSEGLLIAVETLISYSVATFIFGWSVKGSTTLFLILLYATGFAGLSMGLLVVQLVPTIYEGIFVVLCYFSFNLTYGGIIWPSEGALLIGRIMSWFLPCGWGISSIQSILHRGWSIMHPTVFNGVSAMILTSILCWIVTVKIFKPRL